MIADRSRLPTAKQRLLYLSAALAILLLPLIGMQFTAEVNWTVSDFVATAALLTLIGVGLECVSRSTTRGSLRAGLFVVVLACGTLIWAQGAVGIIS